jgi:hypothetical protein
VLLPPQDSATADGSTTYPRAEVLAKHRAADQACQYSAQGGRLTP